MPCAPLTALRIAALGGSLLVSACSLFDEPLPECTTHASCTEWLRRESGSATPGHCVQPAGKCVPLLTEECSLVTGDPLDDDAILLGSLLTEELRHTEAAIMAIEELNSSFAGGGIPRAGNAGKPRPLALLSCVESATEPLTAARHLIETLRVPAVVGPDIDENALDIARELLGNGASDTDTTVMSPTSLIDDLGTLPDRGLMWRDVPSGLTLAPLVLMAYTELEQSLRATKSELELGIVYRDDAFGQNAMAQISARVQFNSKPLVDPTNAPFVRISKYPRGDAQALAALAAEYQKDPPDLMLLLGGVESITGFMQPLELALGEASAASVENKPNYLLFESNKVTELLDLLNPAKTQGIRPDLRRRLRGVGLAPTPSSQPVDNAFRLAFSSRFGRSPGATGMGSTYDAVYAFAAALAATASETPSGANVAAGLTTLSGATPGTGPLQVGRLDALRILTASSAGPPPTVLGTLNQLKWHDNGDYVAGLGELWCVSASTGSPFFASGGVAMDLETRSVTGAWQPCE